MSRHRLCWLAAFSDYPCEGMLRKVHLIEKQAIRRKGGDPWDPRSWVWACGGWTGLEGCHGRFDGFRFTVPRAALPPEVEDLAEELKMGYYLDRRFGARPA
jgi:hypothetical protein